MSSFSVEEPNERLGVPERVVHGVMIVLRSTKTLPLLGAAEITDQPCVEMIRQRRLARPKQGFYLILRPEDRAAGGPDPARWIDPLMHHLGLDYRISLLRAAAFHGASPQAAQVFQVIVPKQLRSIAIDSCVMRTSRPRNYVSGGKRHIASSPPTAVNPLSKVITRPPCRRTSPRRYRSVICFAVVAVRTSAIVAGGMASGQNS